MHFHRWVLIRIPLEVAAIIAYKPYSLDIQQLPIECIMAKFFSLGPLIYAAIDS